jgi:N-carbamoyl-L-amino-acid hydrolase
MSGKLDAATAAELRDRDGRTLAEAIDSVGGRATDLGAARRSPGDPLRYLELHIEQSASLDRAQVPFGVVTAIAAPSRYRVKVRGRQDHAGGTPMGDRRDAAAAAAEVVLLVERVAREAGRGMVGTVGVVETRPNMVNVIPGEADLLVDFRGIEPEAIADTLARFEAGTAAIGARRGVAIEWTSLMRDAPLTVSADMVGMAEDAARAVGTPWRRLTSGASHDANHVARLCPIGLLFIPCRDGRSHCPEEWAEVEHLATGARVLLELLLRLDRDLA